MHRFRIAFKQKETLGRRDSDFDLKRSMFHFETDPLRFLNILYNAQFFFSVDFICFKQGILVLESPDGTHIGNMDFRMS